jgi:hypothetical protein
MAEEQGRRRKEKWKGEEEEISVNSLQHDIIFFVRFFAFM